MLDVNAIQTYLRHLKTSIKILIGSFLLGILSALPILIYIAIGPEDGNPIGLGLLALFGVPLSAIGIITGLFMLLLEYIKGKNSP
jgi:hypothetical protein